MQMQDRPPTQLMATMWFTGEPLGEAIEGPSGRITFDSPIAFDSEAALDAVIGHLSRAKYQIAQARIARENEQRWARADDPSDLGAA